MSRQSSPEPSPQIPSLKPEQQNATPLAQVGWVADASKEEPEPKGLLLMEGTLAFELYEALAACVQRMKDDGYHSDEVEDAEDAMAKARGEGGAR